MPITITVNVTGTTPVYVYLCDNPVTNCVYIDEVNTSPFSFNVPEPLDSQSSYNIKVIDSNGCEIIETINII